MNAPYLITWIYVVAAGIHTLHGLIQLPKSDSTVEYQPKYGVASEYGLERYIHLYPSVAPLLVLHTILMWLAFRLGRVGRATVDTTKSNHACVALLSMSFIYWMHGSCAAWPVMFVVVGRGVARLAQQRTTRYVLIWLYSAGAVLLNHWFKEAYPSSLMTFLKDGSFVEKAFLFRGLAPRAFSVAVVFKYTALRYISYSIDDLSGALEQASCLSCPTACNTSWAAYLGYVFFAPLYLVGPLLPAASYMQQLSRFFNAQISSDWAGRSLPSDTHMSFSVATAEIVWAGKETKQGEATPKRLAGNSLGRHMSIMANAATDTAGSYSRSSMPTMMSTEANQKDSKDCNMVKSAARLLMWIAVVEVSRRTFYAPELLLPYHETLWPWQVWHALLCLLAALWLQSLIPWALSRICAQSLGVHTVDETPIDFVTASVSARKFWRSFHVSWYQWLLQYVYLPAGGGSRGATMVMLVSTVLHGIRGPWLLWGALNLAMLEAERAWQHWSPQKVVQGLPRHLLQGLHHTLAMASMVVLLPLPHWTCLCWFSAVNLPLCVLVSMGMERSTRGR